MQLLKVNRRTEKGSASIFVVIFTMLVVSTIAIGFTSIMLREQAQSTHNDLSQSAYDSAIAGVEDAKRAILKYYNDCDGGATTGGECDNMRNAFLECNSNRKILYTDGDQEVKISSSTSSHVDEQLDQAYTCVKTIINTEDYVGEDLAEGQQVLIPLKGIADYNSIRISWFNRADIARSDNKTTLPSLSVSSPQLPYNNTADYPSNRPPVLRTQFIQTGASFTLDDFDNNDGVTSNTNSMFLYPVKGSFTNNLNITDIDQRRSPNNEPQQVSCKDAVDDDGYACSTTINLPDPIGGGPRSHAYLVLRPFYNKTSYKVEMLDGAGAVVLFAGVQPRVDSTGRANDIFRRVAARVEPNAGSNVMPVGAVETSSNFCKEFSVTDVPEGYNPGSCKP